MENLKEIKISESLYRDIRAYCQLNNLNVEKFIEGLLKKNFMEEKYGTKPNIHRKPKNTSATPEKVEILTSKNLEKTVIVKTEKHPEITVTPQKEVKEEPKKVVEEEKPVKQEEETPKVKKRFLS